MRLEAVVYHRRMTRRRRSAATAWVLASVLVASGCSLFTSLDDLDGDPVPDASDGAPASPDASRDDTTRADVTSTSQSDAGGDAGPEPLVVNGGFEQPGVGCGPGWVAGKGTGTRVSPGATSGYACRVCSAVDYRDVFFVKRATPIDGGAGTWQLQMSARVEPDAGYKSPVQYYLYVRARLADGGVTGAYNGGAVGPTWQAAQVSLDAPPGTIALDVEVGGDGDPGSCIALDDVVLARP